MNGPDWLEITRLLQGNFTSIFSFRGASHKPPPEDRWSPDPPAEEDLPPPRGGVYILPRVYIQLKHLNTEDN